MPLKSRESRPSSCDGEPAQTWVPPNRIAMLHHQPTATMLHVRHHHHHLHSSCLNREPAEISVCSSGIHVVDAFIRTDLFLFGRAHSLTMRLYNHFKDGKQRDGPLPKSIDDARARADGMHILRGQLTARRGHALIGSAAATEWGAKSASHHEIASPFSKHW